MTEQEQQELAKVQKEIDDVWEVRKKLILGGLAPDSEPVQILDAREWLLVFRIYELRKGEAAAAKLLSEIRGRHQN